MCGKGKERRGKAGEARGPGPVAGPWMDPLLQEGDHERLKTEECMREEPLLKRQGALVGAGPGADGNVHAGGFRGGLRTRSIDALPFDAPLDLSFRRQYLHFASRAREVGNGACVTVTATLTVFVFSLCILASVADLPF